MLMLPDLPATVAAQRLVGPLGFTMTAALSGVLSEQVTLWCDGQEPVPVPVPAARLRCAWRVFCIVSAHDGPDVARSWFLGCNPWLDDRPVVMAVFEDDFDAVQNAALAYVEGAFTC